MNPRATKVIDEEQSIADAAAKLESLENLRNGWRNQQDTDAKPAILRDLSDQIEQIQKKIAVHQADQQQAQFEIDQILKGPPVLAPENSH